ncbi:MAG: STAS-like domain-containing protein [Nanoarchaeota archaeon]
MITIKIKPLIGTFAENKDIARSIRLEKITPKLEAGKDIILDFAGVDSATQSFIHALLAEIIRRHGNEALDHILFKNCTDAVKKMITIVIDYVQESE